MIKKKQNQNKVFWNILHVFMTTANGITILLLH